MDVTIRLDVINDDDADVLKKYLDKYSKYLVYEEIADITKKKHYQGIIRVNDEKEFNACKVRFTTMFPNHKASKKSMSKVRSKNYEIYIAKDGKVFERKGYSDEEIQALQEKSYKKGNEPVASSLAKAMSYCKDRGITDSSNGWSICETLIDYYRENVKCEPNDFQLRNMTKSIYTHLCYERSVRQGNPAIYENYKKERSREIMGSTWIY